MAERASSTPGITFETYDGGITVRLSEPSVASGRRVTAWLGGIANTASPQLALTKEEAATVAADLAAWSAE